MAADVGAIVIDIVTRSEKSRADLERFGAAVEATGKRTARASNEIERSANRAGVAARNLGFQIGDIGTQLGSGSSPFLILAQQGSQVVQALEDIALSGASVGTVLKTIAVPSALALLAAFTPLIAKLFEGDDAIVKQKDSYKKLVEAVDEYTGKLGNAASSETVKIRLLELGTQAIVAQEIATRNKIKADIEAAKAARDLQFAQDRKGNLAAPLAQGNVNSLEGKLAAQDKKIADAQARARTATGNRIRQDIAANSDGADKVAAAAARIAKAEQSLDLAEFSLARKLNRGDITPAEYEKRLLAATRKRDAVINTERDVRRTPRSERAANPYKGFADEGRRSIAEQEERLNPFPAIQSGAETFNQRLADVRKNLRDLAQEVPDVRTPLMQFVDDLEVEGANIDMALSGIAADGLDRLGDGLADAIAGTQSLGDAFKNVATQIIADLARIAIRQSIVKPLASALSLGGGGGIFAAIGSVFGGKGRASGGYVEGGQMYRVNEGASPGRVEGFRPLGSGHVIPLGQMNVAAPSRGMQQNVVIHNDLRGTIVEEKLYARLQSEALQTGAAAGAYAGQTHAGKMISAARKPPLPGSWG